MGRALGDPKHPGAETQQHEPRGDSLVQGEIMDNSANVTSVEALTDFRAVWINLQEKITQAITTTEGEITAAFRFLPLGHGSPVQPYLGAGVGVFSWRYSEAGEFVDFADGSVFRDRFVGSGATAGPVIFGGLAFVGDVFGAGGEIRYQSAQGELPTDKGFSGSKIDLGGVTYSVTFKIRF